MTYCIGYSNRCNCISKPLQYPFATGVKCIGSQTAALDLMQQFSGLLQRYVTAAYELICGSAYSTYSSRWFSSGVPSSMVSSAYSDQTNSESGPPSVKAISTKMEFNRVNCLVWVLHESARSFSETVESFELLRSGPELAMAWVGVDVHAWHKHIAHKVCT